MARTLKVYGWQGWRTECPPAANGSCATREICATPSKAALYRLVPDSRVSDFFNICETGNAGEIRKAMARPGVIFWRGLDDYGENGVWRCATGEP